MALAAYAIEHGGITLSSTQLDIARKIISALKPVEEIAKIIFTNSACISAVIPLVKILEKALNKDEDDAGMLLMKAEMLKALQRQFDNIEEIDELSIATYVPCSSKIRECFTELQQEVGATSDTCGGVEAMVDRYLCELLIDYKSGNPLKWLDENKRRFPLFVNLTKHFLSAPPTSVPSERLFSAISVLYDEQRNRLSVEYDEMLLCIKYNMFCKC